MDVLEMTVVKESTVIKEILGLQGTLALGDVRYVLMQIDSVFCSGIVL